MTVKLIILAICITICNVIMDTLRFHYSKTFGLFIKPDSNLDKWLNPSKSWTNKYIFKSKLLTFVFSTILVWITDAWHFLKAIIINLSFIIYLVLVETNNTFIQWIIILLFLNLMWFIVYETSKGILLWLPSVIIKVRNLIAKLCNLFHKGRKQ